MTALDWSEPSLFDDWDAQAQEAEKAAQAERDAIWRRPATCPTCGRTEPNGYLLRQGHGYGPDLADIYGFPPGQHPVYGAMCSAQYHRLNQLIYMVLQQRRGRPVIAEHDGYEVVKGDNLLDKAIDRADAVRLDADSIVADYSTRPISPDCLNLMHQRCDGDGCECGCTHHGRRAAA